MYHIHKTIRYEKGDCMIFFRLLGHNIFFSMILLQKSNGQKSMLRETQDQVKSFDSESEKNISIIQSQLRSREYKFSAARGVLQKKKNKKPRPIVMAPVKDRVVQRAILQVLQDHKSILNDLDTPYSFGGLQEKNVEKAVLEVQKTMRSGASYFIKSDIKQFFTKIDKTKVMEIFSKTVPFEDVIEVLERSLETQLCKED